MKTVYQIDEQGFMTYLTIEIGESDKVPQGYVNVPLPSDQEGKQLPFWKPKWNGVEWIETRPREDIEAEKKTPKPLTRQEATELDVANIIFESMMDKMKIAQLENDLGSAVMEIMSMKMEGNV